MAKVLVDVVLKDGEDSVAFSDSFSSNTNVELKNPMVSIPSLVVMRVEESYFDTFKSDSRIKVAERPDQTLMCSPAAIPAVTTMSGKNIVVSSNEWDTSNPGSDYIGAQFYYDSDSIPPNPLAEQTQTVYLTAYGSGNYVAEANNDNLSITFGQSNPTINILEGMTLELTPPGAGYAGEITAAGGGVYSIKDWSRSVNNFYDGATPSSNPTFNLEVGDTLDLYNSGVYTGHPIYFKTAATTGTGDLITTGVYGQGADGATPYQASAGIDTAGWTPGTYYYQCGNHAGMGGQIIVHAAGSYYNHPLYLKTVQGSGTGNQLTNGGSISGVSGQGSNAETTKVKATFGAGSAGTYYYQCSLHSSMNGQIVVTAGDNNTVGTRTWSAGANPDTATKYSNVKWESRWTGKNVDIVTMEVGGGFIAANHHENHPDFDSLTSPGTTRFIPQDWPGLSDTGNNQVSDGTERLTSHGCGVLSAAGGTICGFAKHSNLYQMSSGSDSFSEMYDSLLTWHNAKSVNGATGKKNPTIAIGEVQWATWWDRAIPIDEIQAITWDGNDAVTRPAAGWGTDFTPFVDRQLIPRQLKDPDTGNWVWVIGMPYNYQYSALKTAMEDCLSAGIHCISAASNQGQIYVKYADDKYALEYIRVNSGATFYSLGVQGNPWELTISKGTTSTTLHSPWYNYGTHGHTDGIDVAAGQNSEQWSVLDSYSCRGPGVDVVGMGANTFTSNPSTTFADGAAIKWGMFSGTSCATPTVVGKAACLLEKYFTYNNDYPTPAELKTIVCQKQYSYGHNSNDTYRKRHIMKSDSTLRSIAGQTGGGIDWSNVPAASGSNWNTHALGGSRGLCQLEVGDYVNGGIVLLENAGTPRQKPFLGTTDDRNRLQQLQGVRPLSGATYPRPKITRTDTYPSLK